MDLQEEILERKRFGSIEKGWYKAQVYDTGTGTPKSGENREFIKVDFEIIDTPGCTNTLVAGFFNFDSEGNPDFRFQRMAVCAGLRGEYDTKGALEALKGAKLMVYVDHIHKSGSRDNRVVDYKLFDMEEEEEEDIPF